MRDFSVNTNGKELNIEEKVIPSSYEVTGLDNILRIDRIDFDESASFIRFSLSDFDIAPFEFTPNSAITVTFPSGFGFDQGDGNVYAGNVAVGQWKDGNKLDIYPGLVKGKEVILRVSSLTLNKTVDQTKKSIEVNNDVEYSANIGVSATTGIDKSALDVLNDKDISFRVSGQLVLLLPAEPLQDPLCLIPVKEDRDLCRSIVGREAGDDPSPCPDALRF